MTKPLPNSRFIRNKIALLYEDEHLLVIDKPAGLLSVGNDRERDRTAFASMTDYVRKGDPKSRRRVFIVHRLDKDTSGLLVMARTEAVQSALQDAWESTERTYLAVLHGTPKKEEGIIENYLAEDDNHVVYVTHDPRRGKLARTEYRVLQSTEDMALVHINLLTGRKNQLRVHFAGIGHPIVGDTKYGVGRQRLRRLALHARTLSLTHPVTQERMTWDAQVPRDLLRLMGRLDRRVVDYLHAANRATTPPAP